MGGVCARTMAQNDNDAAPRCLCVRVWMFVYMSRASAVVSRALFCPALPTLGGGEQRRACARARVYQKLPCVDHMQRQKSFVLNKNAVMK
jgi:hypothetical protein